LTRFFRINKISLCGRKLSSFILNVPCSDFATLSLAASKNFAPCEGEVRFYYCGPTVWNYGHIGNFRSAVAADILRRYLKFKGYKVTHVMNITDVEDRIIAKSQKPD
jgi:cysteinyl-tRNA synthetase